VNSSINPGGSCKKKACGNGPDFLLIGAARSGTTWLYNRLKLHKDIFVPPVKEIHYFDIYRKYPFWHWIRVRRMVLHMKRFAMFAINRSDRNPVNIFWLSRWGLHYFLLPKTHSWYRGIFNDPAGRRSGELTPAYALLHEDDIADIVAINPAVKIIFQMRDPIDRVWSQVVMHLRLHQRSGNYGEYIDEIREVTLSDEVLDRSRYLDTIEKWERYVKPENICYLFFDDIQSNPSGLLLRLFSFLDAELGSQLVFSKKLTDKVASRETHGRNMPAEIERELAGIFLPMLTELEQRFEGGWPGKWRSRAELVLNG
jgi:hypothetical protein